MTAPRGPYPPRAGDVLAGKYVVDGILGSGGMGVVVAATHLRLGTRVAIKVPSPARSSSPVHRARFLREAHAAAKLKSQHVARVLDIDDLAPGIPFLVMERLDGADLAELLEMRGAMPVDEVVATVLQACEGVAEAHAAGIVHRDLKPSNLFVTRAPDGSPLVKLLDFGVSKLRVTMSPETALTGKDARLGSPQYMAPEQRRAAADVDERADIWSLGVVLYEMLAGKAPFVADKSVSLSAAVVATAPAALAGVRDDVPEQLERAIARCLAKEPAARFATVAELARALAPFAPDGEAGAARVARVLAAQREPEATRVASLAAATEEQPPPSGPTTIDLDAPPATTGAVQPQSEKAHAPTTTSREHRSLILPAVVLLVLVVSLAWLALWWSDRQAGHAPSGAAPTSS